MACQLVFCRRDLSVKFSVSQKVALKLKTFRFVFNRRSEGSYIVGKQRGSFLGIQKTKLQHLGGKTMNLQSSVQCA